MTQTGAWLKQRGLPRRPHPSHMDKLFRYREDKTSLQKRVFTGGIEIEEIAEGLLVRQGGEAYVARNWRLTAPVIELIERALASGLVWMIRDDHPRRNIRWPNTRGVVYVAFSPTPGGQWSLAIDTFRPASGNYGHAVFNGKYHAQFVKRGIPFVFEGRNQPASHLVVASQQVIPVIEALAEFDHTVLALNRAPHTGDGFTTEYVIQRVLLEGWEATPWGERYAVVQDEFPVDGGRTSRRIDILARERATGDWLVVELKRAEASVAAVRQVADYVLALGRRDDFAHARLDGVLIAERIPSTVREVAEREGVALYEIRWPMHLARI